jgi:hypothetical protein
MCIYFYFYHISLQILNCIYKKFENGKIPYSFLPSLFEKCFLLILPHRTKHLFTI